MDALIYCIAILLLLFEFYAIYSTYLSYNEKNKLCAIIFFVEFFIIIAFRDVSVLNDTKGYALHFSKINSDIPFYITKASDRFETGYLIFEQFIHNKISSSFLVYDIITTTIILGSSVFFFYKHSSCVWIALFLFSINLMFSEIIAVREGLAISVSLWGYYFLEKKNYLVYLLFVGIAYLLHSSAIILLVLLLVQLKWKTPKWRTFIIILSIFVFYFFTEIIMMSWHDDDSIYKTTMLKKGFFALIGVFNSISATVLTCYIYFLRIQSKNNNEDSTIIDENYNEEDNFFISVVLINLIVSVFSIRVFVFQRFSMYLMPYTFTYASTLYVNQHHNPKIKIWTTAYLLFAIFMFVYEKTVRPEWINLLPYKFYGQ